MNHYPAGPHLSRIETPSDLREHFNIEDLPAVCDELRDFIVDVVSEKGGHFGASLGVVELTVALHYAFNTPEDQLVWDVGHQAAAPVPQVQPLGTVDARRRAQFAGIGRAVVYVSDSN